MFVPGVASDPRLRLPIYLLPLLGDINNGDQWDWAVGRQWWQHWAGLAGLFRTITSQRQILLALQHIFRPQSYEENKKQLTLLENHMGSWISSITLQSNKLSFYFYFSLQVTSYIFLHGSHPGDELFTNLGYFSKSPKLRDGLVGKLSNFLIINSVLWQIHFNKNTNNQSVRWHRR